MKTVRIISMIVMVLITLFFIVYANVQSNLALEKADEAAENLMEASKQHELAERAAADATLSEAKARAAKAEARRLAQELHKCKNQ